MEYCKYHPLIPATNACHHCHTRNCDDCTSDGGSSLPETCFICHQDMEFLGAVNNAVPFWRRLEESFHYPLNTQTMMLVVGISFLSSILTYVPFTFIWYLMLTGAFLKYCFSCLDNTAHGLLVAPDIAEAYGGGLGLIARLLVIVVATIAIIIATESVLGSVMATVVAAVLIAGLPATLISFAMSDSLAVALNPLSMLRLVTSIGLPYGLLLGFILIMSVSVGVISEFIGSELSLVTGTLQSAVANYYLIVVFHLMGYMIFQYQGEIGFTASESLGEAKEIRSDRDRLAANIDVTLKEGDYEKVLDLFSGAIKRSPNDMELYGQAFKFLCATKNVENLDGLSSMYLELLVKNNRTDQLRNVYKLTVQISPNFIPDRAETRFALAKSCYASGDFVAAIKLINGIHKHFPEYSELVPAYELLLDCLEQVPNMRSNMGQCKKLIAHLKTIAPEITEPEEKVIEKAQFLIDVEPSHANENAGSTERDPGSNDQPKELPPIDFK
jgi:hypothetical protein